MSKQINFFKGHPTKYLLPAKEIAAAFNKVLLGTDYLSYESDPLNQHPLTYGTDPGNYDVRKAISKWNDRNFGRANSEPDNINLTGGASYGFANILTSVTDASSITKRGFIVSPTYYLINSAFIDAGFENKLTAIQETPGEEYDIDLKYLEDQLFYYSKGLESSEERELNIIKDPIRQDRKLYRFVIYLVPTFSNPGGLTYSTKTRIKLIELARRYDLLIISDDVYDLLDYTDNENPVPRFNYLDQDSLPAYKTFGNTISNGTFSKIIAPGLRVGWQESPTAKLAQQLAITGANRSGGTPGQLATLVVQNLIESDELDRIIENFKQSYKKRAKTLLQCIRNYLPSNTKVYGGDGGYFVWVNISSNINHKNIVNILQDDFNVVLAPGDSFEVCGDTKGWGKCCVRLSISYLTETEIEEGIRTWGQVLRREHPELF